LDLIEHGDAVVLLHGRNSGNCAHPAEKPGLTVSRMAENLSTQPNTELLLKEKC